MIVRSVTLLIFVCSGTATFTIIDNQIPLTGPHSIVGRAVVVHADPDDLGKGNLSISPSWTDLCHCYMFSLMNDEWTRDITVLDI